MATQLSTNHWPHAIKPRLGVQVNMIGKKEEVPNERHSNWMQFRRIRRVRNYSKPSGTEVKIQQSGLRQRPVSTVGKPLKAIHSINVCKESGRGTFGSSVPPNSVLENKNVSALTTQRKFITTNPNIRRRFSAEGLPVDTNFSPNTPVKQMKVVSVSDYQSNEEQSQSIVSTPQRTNSDRPQSEDHLKKHHRLSLSKKLKIRRSTCSLKSLKMESSDWRKSCLQSWSNLCKVLKTSNSSNNMLDQSSSSSPNPNSCPLPILNQPCDIVLERNMRTVEIKRQHHAVPFGIVVNRSSKGLCIQRVLRYTLLNKNQCNLDVGDEIVELNGIPCQNLNCNQLSQLVQHNESIKLTVIGQRHSLSCLSSIQHSMDDNNVGKFILI